MLPAEPGFIALLGCLSLWLVCCLIVLHRMLSRFKK